jgi:DNA invertase Pin-like site-specific DNA recombinase
MKKITNTKKRVNINNVEKIFMMTILGAMAEMERNIIRERVMRRKTFAKNKAMAV